MVLSEKECIYQRQGFDDPYLRQFYTVTADARASTFIVCVGEAEQYQASLAHPISAKRHWHGVQHPCHITLFIDVNVPRRRLMSYAYDS